MPTANLADVLDVSRLPRTPRLWVNSAKVEDYTDWTGEAALRVNVILAEEVVVENIPGKDVTELKSAIRRQLQDRGLTLFPYIFLAKQSELDDQED